MKAASIKDLARNALVQQACNTTPQPVTSLLHGLLHEKADATCWRWRIHFTDRDPIEFACAPAMTHAEALGDYPDAIAAEPVPDTGRQATDAEAAELKALVALLFDADRDEALAHAMSHAADALACFRLLAKERGADNRRRCSQCAHVTAAKQCLAAMKGEIPQSRITAPQLDALWRCEGYLPKPDDPDRRPGNERWPGLMESQS